MLAAPYIIIGCFISPTATDPAAIAADIRTQMPLASAASFALMPGVDAFKVTTANMQVRLDEVAAFFVGMNQAHGGTIRWFAQLCEKALIALE